MVKETHFCQKFSSKQNANIKNGVQIVFFFNVRMTDPGHF